MFLYSLEECKARALDEAADFEAKFLVFDTWWRAEICKAWPLHTCDVKRLCFRIRFFDGETRS